MLPVLIFGVYINEFQLLVAKPPTSLFMRERKPVPPGRGSLTGNDSLGVAQPPLPVTAGPGTGQDVAERKESGRLPLASDPL